MSTVSINILGRNGTTRGVCLIDEADLSLVEKYRWYVCGNGYVAAPKHNLLLHRYLMQPPEGMVIDHINGDKLDNRRRNLRVCTHAQNVQNRKGANKTSKTGIRGVGYHPESGKWRARVSFLGKEYTSYHSTLESAVEGAEALRARFFTHSLE